MLAAYHSGGRLLGRPSIGAMFKSRAAAMYPYIRQQWVGSASSDRRQAVSGAALTSARRAYARCTSYS